MTTDFESSVRVDVSQEVGTLVLRLSGELDLATRLPVERAVFAAIPTAYAVVLDLEELTFCDSTGLAMFVAARQEAVVHHTTLTFRNVRPAVARVFAISGIDHLLDIRE
jgi:anti-anti-sigma factor